MKSFVADGQDAGMRLDIFLSLQFPKFARSVITKLINNGLVLVNRSSVKAGYKLKHNDLIEIDTSLLDSEPEMIDLPIVYEDQDVIIINKPPGILSHAKGSLLNEATVAGFLRNKYKLGAGESATNRLGIVHRLDRDTSGVMICAKNISSQKWLQKQFSLRKVKKKYIAVVVGHPETQEAIIDVPIARNPNKPQSFMAHHTGKTAQTHYRVLNTGKNYSLAELVPRTGRTHQLRVHMNYIKHPIVGDRVYGKPDERLFLHASELEITLPNRSRQKFSAETPKNFAKKAIE